MPRTRMENWRGLQMPSLNWNLPESQRFSEGITGFPVGSGILTASEAYLRRGKICDCL